MKHLKSTKKSCLIMMPTKISWKQFAAKYIIVLMQK